MITACISTMTSAIEPSQTLFIMVKISAVSAWLSRKAGWMKASPMKLPIGSTSSLIILATSAGFTARISSGRKRSSSPNRS